MKIRLLKAYSLYCAGDVIDTFDDGVCALLIARGIAEEYHEEPTAWNKMLAQPEPIRKERNGRR